MKKTVKAGVLTGLILAPAAVVKSDAKKQVTNYDALKSSKKEADIVDKVRQLISEINPNASNFESKLKAARSAYDRLTTPQTRLVSNYYLLEDYESQSNNSGFFF